MPNEVRPFPATWLDKQFKKSYQRLTSAEQTKLSERLAGWLTALKACSHPVHDPALRPYRPSRYQGVAVIRGGGTLVEYRFRARCAPSPAASKAAQRYRVLLLVAVTISHDHERMKKLIRQHRADFHIGIVDP